jgi:guanylate kinase
MGKIFYVMGKSSSGKDSLYRALLNHPELQLKRIVLYTTRPIRAGEKDGEEYHFVGEKELEALDQAQKVIELRSYDTVQGIWKYFTVDDGIDLSSRDYLAIGTLVSYKKTAAYYGQEKVVPLYIEVEDGERLMRAIQREQTQVHPDYEELCRRFLADCADFSEEKLNDAKITRRFSNGGALEDCVREAAEYIKICR